MHNVYKYSKYIDTLVVIEKIGLNMLKHCARIAQYKVVGAGKRGGRWQWIETREY